jgi:hypothetical protein
MGATGFQQIVFYYSDREKERGSCGKAENEISLSTKEGKK